VRDARQWQIVVAAAACFALRGAAACSSSEERPPIRYATDGTGKSPCAGSGGVCVQGDAKTAVCREGFYTTGTPGACPQDQGPMSCCFRDATWDAGRDATGDAFIEATADASGDASGDASMDAASDAPRD
jgi:hypothetical protein